MQRLVLPRRCPGVPVVGSTPCGQAFVVDPQGAWSGIAVTGGISLGLGF
ncbi:MAG: hypothetical protein AAF628_29265 [Planctomycetota bacterium]